MAGYSGDAGDAVAGQTDSIHMSNGRMFSTQDSDNDVSGGNCAVDQGGGGWWYGDCSRSVLNRDDDGHWSYDGYRDVQASSVLVKLN